MSGANQPCLSVALIVRDAADALHETLASVQAIADEIVVVDTGSSDPTREVAEQFGARVVRHAWKDDFSEARNACKKHLSGKWVYWLDVGEHMSAEDVTALGQFVRRDAKENKAYAMIVRVPPSRPGSAAEQVARIRLVPNHPLVQYRGRVRETLAESLAAAQIELDSLSLRIVRGSREHDPEIKTERARRNIRLSEMEIREHGPSAHLLNCLGDAFQTLEDNPRAREFFRHALAASRHGSVEMLEAYYGLITSPDPGEDKNEEPLSLCVQALEAFPLDAQLLCAMGGYLHAQGRSDLALRAYRTAYQHGQVNPMVWHVGEVREIAAICNCVALQADNRPQEAEAILKDALQGNKSSVRLRRHLMDFYIKRGDRDRALAQVDELPGEMPQREAFRSAVRGACVASQGNWIAAKAFLKTAYVTGCRDVVCLQWLAITYLVGGEPEEARPLLLEWQALDPRNAEAARFLNAIDSAAETQHAVGHRLRVDAPGPAGSPPPASIDIRQSAGNAPEPGR